MEWPKSRNERIEVIQTQVNAINNDAKTHAGLPHDAAALTTQLGLVEAKKAEEEGFEAQAALARDERLALEETLWDMGKDNWKQGRINYKDNPAARDALGDTTTEARSGVPGQVRNFVVRRQGPGSLIGEFLAPLRTSENGEARIYEVQFRVADADGVFPEWEQAQTRTVFEKEFFISALPQNVKIEIRIVARNQHGYGLPSNVETVVL